MQKIGTIKLIQIQRDSMKTYENGERIYRPDSLLTVDKLLLTSEGIMGIPLSGEEIIDVHHVKHPQSRFRGDNKISFGFTQHYQRMCERFGDHIVEGAGGENMIIEANSDISKLDYKRRFFIQHQAEESLIELTNIIPAPPCREFSVFCLQVPQCQDDIKAALQFLDNGTRGYYAELLENDRPCFVQTGDTLFIA